MTEIKNLKNENLLCIETDNCLDIYLLYWYILPAELMNCYCWLYDNTVQVEQHLLLLNHTKTQRRENNLKIQTC